MNNAITLKNCYTVQNQSSFVGLGIAIEGFMNNIMYQVHLEGSSLFRLDYVIVHYSVVVFLHLQSLRCVAKPVKCSIDCCN